MNIQNKNAKYTIYDCSKGNFNFILSSFRKIRKLPNLIKISSTLALGYYISYRIIKNPFNHVYCIYQNLIKGGEKNKIESRSDKKERFLELFQQSPLFYNFSKYFVVRFISLQLKAYDGYQRR